MPSLEVFAFFDSCTPFLVLWITVFLGVTILKIALRSLGRDLNFLEGAIGSELPGLPLSLLHTACFGYAIWRLDFSSVLLFAWWGPGFVVVAVWYLYVNAKKIPFDWSPYARATSVLCKLIYALLMVMFFYHRLPGIPFVFSIWIMHDQIRLSWFDGNADRTRRVCEDFWIVRVAYWGLLFVPWFAEDFPLRALALTLGPLITVLWLAGLFKVVRARRFRTPPENPGANLRDIVYLPRSAPDATK